MSNWLRHLPNVLSFGRMLAVLPVGWWLYEEDYPPAAALFVAAAVTDVVDGALARGFGWQSRLGGVIDPIADKLLLLVTAGLLWWNQVLPTWLWALMLSRDLIIVLGAWLHHRLFEPFEAHPSLPGKLATASQVLLLLSMMAGQAGWLATPWLPWLLGATAVALLASGLDYVYRYTRRAIALSRTRR